jgi:hypothetical protein
MITLRTELSLLLGQSRNDSGKPVTVENEVNADLRGSGATAPPAFEADGCAEFARCDNLTNCPGHLEGIKGYTCAREGACPRNAGVAQSVEHRFCKPRVGGSNPFASSSIRRSVNESQETNFRQAAEV